jgi:PAT family beta-lactamase induction signal transducer AmpG
MALVVAVLIKILHFFTALLVAWTAAVVLVKSGLVEYRLVEQTYLIPVRDFFDRYGWSLAWILLALIGSYRISDIVLGVISAVFYQDLGYSKSEIATVVKTFGLLMTLAGGFLGGMLAYRYGVMRILLLGAILSAATNLLFMLLASIGYDMTWLYIVISADNLSAGIASAAFVAFLSSLTNISFTAMQYAIFSSLMTLLPKVLGGFSGSMVDAMGYSNFFMLTALLGLPVLVLIMVAARRFQIREHSA